MSVYLNNFNTDDSFFRSMIVGLLNFMTNRLYIWTTINNEKHEQHVPFYYNAGGDERFMQDLFQQHTLNDCITEKVVEANTDIIPRGHIALSSIAVQASSLNNRFVRGEYLKEVNGEIITYNAPMNLIPLEMAFDCKIIADTKTMSFKLLQRLLQTFYKAHAFEFMFELNPYRAMVAFPEDMGLENIHEFTFGDNTDSNLNFQIAVETNLPVIDYTQSFMKSDRIEKFGLELNPGSIYWPDKDLDGNNVYDNGTTQTTPITVVNNEAIPKEMSDASRVQYLESLFKTSPPRVAESPIMDQALPENKKSTADFPNMKVLPELKDMKDFPNLDDSPIQKDYNKK